MTVEAREVDKLRWQCRRGLLELDIILQKFMEQDYQKLDKQEKTYFSKLLLEADTDLLAYITKTEKCSDPDINHILKKYL